MNRTSILALILLQSTPALAIFGTGGTNISQTAPCVGLDGIPITAGAMEAMCCSGGRLNANAPAQCRAGFNTISGDAVGGAASSITLAQQTLGVAGNLNGVQTNINLTNAPNSGINTTSNPTRSTSSGLLSGSDPMNNDGRGLSGANLAGGGRGGGGAGAGGMGGGGGSGGGFSGLGGGSGSGNGGNGAGTDPNADANKPLGGGFAANGGGNGKGSEFGNMDLNFGGSGSGGADGGGNGMEELGFGDEELAEGEAGGDVEGTINDPANYFSLTNKGDDIFKIVSRRYTKKYKKLVLKDKHRVPASKFQQNKPL